MTFVLKKKNRQAKKTILLHQERNVPRHCRKPGSRIPAVRHERDDGDGPYECRARAKGSKNSQFFVPEPQEQEGTEQPFRNPSEPTRAADAEHRIQPENERAVAD